MGKKKTWTSSYIKGSVSPLIITNSKSKKFKFKMLSKVLFQTMLKKEKRKILKFWHLEQLKIKPRGKKKTELNDKFKLQCMVPLGSTYHREHHLLQHVPNNPQTSIVFILPAKFFQYLPYLTRHIKEQGNNRRIIIAINDEAHFMQFSSEVPCVFLQLTYSLEPWNEPVRRKVSAKIITGI